VRNPLPPQIKIRYESTVSAILFQPSIVTFLPPYTDNPFAGLGGKRARVDDAKPVFVLGRQSRF
jgi:hypothetical protein